MERLSPELRDLVEAERGEVEPTPAELDGVRRKLLARAGGALAAGAVAGTVAKSAAGAGGASGAAAVGAGTALAVKLGVSALVLGAAALVAVPRWRGSSPEGRPAPPAGAAAAPATGVAAASAAEAAPAPAAATAPAAGAEATTSAAEAAPPGARAAERPSSSSGGERPLPPLSEEVRLLKEAQGALKGGRPAAALAALAEHERRFPRGQLALERSAARIGALCALGRVAEARRAGEAFLARHGSTALAEQVRSSCAGAGSSGR